MLKRITLLAILLFGIISYSQNCNYVFLGELKDFHDDSPISGATIHIENQNKYLSSDINGKFKVSTLCNTTLKLTISHVGCETKTVSIPINSNSFKTIFIEHHIEELSEVDITTNASKTGSKTIIAQTLNTNTIAKYSHLSLGDVLQEIPGVSSINTGNSIVKPMIHGLHSSRILILNNGVRLQDQEWGAEHAPTVDINAADNITVIKGANALAYGGDAIGGVIALKPKRIIVKDTLFGKTTLSGQTNGRGYFANTSLSKNFKSGWFANVQGTIKQNGDFSAPNYILTNTGLKSNAFTISSGKKTFPKGFEVYYSYFKNQIGILRASHIGNIRRDLINSINAQQPNVIEPFSYAINAPKQEVTHHVFKGVFYQRFKNFGKLNVQYNYQNNHRFEFDIRRGDDKNTPAVDLNLKTHTILADVKLDNAANRKIHFGLMGSYQNNFANPNTGVRRLIPDYDKYDFGAFTTFEYSVNTNLQVNAGVRYDFNRIDAKKFYQKSRWEERNYNNQYANLIIDDIGSQYLVNPVLDYHNVSVAAGLNYKVDASSAIKVNYALASRPPNPAELFSDGLHHSAARIELGDLNINKEVSHKIAAAYSYNSNTFSISAEPYFNYFNNYIFIKPTGVTTTIRGDFPVWEFNQTTAQIFGVDVNAVFEFTNNLSLKNNSAFIKGFDITNQQALIDIPAFSTQNSIQYNNKKWYHFNSSLKSEWVFRQNEFPNFNFTVSVPPTNAQVLVDVSTPPPAYHLLHFYNEVRFNFGKNTTLNVGLNITNVLNTNYRNYLNRLRFFADEIGRNATLQLTLNY